MGHSAQANAHVAWYARRRSRPRGEFPAMRVAMVSFDAGEYGVQVANAISNDAQVLLLIPRHAFKAYESKLDPRVERYVYDLPRIREPHRQAVAMAKLRR